jgi:hypothetical protein
MTQNRLTAVIDGLINLRASIEARDPSLESPLVAYLLGAINATSISEDRGVLFSLLSAEYGFLGFEENEEHAIRASIEECPADPDTRIAMSEFRLRKSEIKEAIAEARSAIQLADSLGRSRRHALQTLARALRKAERFGELEETLRKLIELKGDTGYTTIETDFLIDLPAGAVSRELVDRYSHLKER